MQQKLSKGKLLDENGHLVEAGYATSLVKEYSRGDIKANKWRIKEWDYYLIYNDNYGVALTIDDNSYMGLNSITLLDFSVPCETTKSPMVFLTKGKVGFPNTSKVGDVVVEKENYYIKYYMLI